MKRIFLHGELGRRYGKCWRLAVGSPHEAIRALIANNPGMETYLCDAANAGVEFRVFIGSEQITETDALLHPFSERESLHIAPVYGGADGGPFQIIAGIVLLFTGAGSALGWALIAGGVIGMLTAKPSQHKNDNTSTEQSFFFDGAENTVSQGGCVPLCYGGPIIVGSDVISSGIFAEDF